jgi:hypothetical protein
MKAIIWIGAILAMLAGLAGLIMFGIGFGEPQGPIIGAIVLGSDFMFIVLLALLQGVVDIKSLLTPPPPVINAVSPTSYPYLNNNQTMTIDGSNFRSGASLTFVNPKRIHIGSLAHKLTFVSSSQLIYQFNNGSQGAGTWSVIVNNPGGQDSNPMSFTVIAAGK